jgi:hypothetical protein
MLITLLLGDFRGSASQLRRPATGVGAVGTTLVAPTRLDTPVVPCADDRPEVRPTVVAKRRHRSGSTTCSRPLPWLDRRRALTALTSTFDRRPSWEAPSRRVKRLEAASYDQPKRVRRGFRERRVERDPAGRRGGGRGRLQVVYPRGAASRRLAALLSADRMCKERSTCRCEFRRTSGSFRSSGRARSGC